MIPPTDDLSTPQSLEDFASFARACPDRAVEWLHNRYYKPLLGYARHLCKDDELALDLTQETFIKLVEELRGGQLTFRVSALNWLRRVCTRRFLDERRRNANSLPLSIDEQPDQSDACDPSELAYEVLRSEALREAIDRILTDEQRYVLVQHYFHGRTYQVLGVELSISPQAVQARVRRAFDRLRKYLADGSFADGDVEERI